MPEVRDLTPADAPELTALYEEYEWWADREVETVREALAETEVAVGVREAGPASDASSAERGSADGRAATPRDDGDEPRAGDGGDLVAAARVLTDFAYYATVYDVVVADDRRGDGLGEVLMEAVRDHPDLRSVQGLSLLCREGLVPFYESVGFEVFGPEFEVPEGGTERLVRMVYEHDEERGDG